MLRIKEAIIVEGRYDKNTLSQLVDAVILETRGFSIFSDTDQLALFRRLASERGLIVLTDSDGAGFLIRNYLKGSIPTEQIKHAYIPDIAGKERRKRQAGKEGKMGVEGMRPQVLVDALRRAGATILDENAQSSPAEAPLTKTDLYLAGLSGAEGSANLRAQLLRKLDLPEHLSPNALLPVLNALYGKTALLALIDELRAAP